MEQPTNVRELFAPLGHRLQHYESFTYLNINDYHGVNIGETIEDFEFYELLINDISKEANRFDFVEVFKEADAYQKRVLRMIEKLVPRERDFFYDKEEGLTLVPISESKQKALFESWKQELELYHFELNNIKQARADAMPSNKEVQNIINTLQPIQLPESFSVRQVNAVGFTSSLSPEEAALLLYYFKEKQIMPSY